MDLLELQQRANVLVDKVNQYEASLVGQEVDENDILNEHTYVDLHSLRPAMKLLFGTTVNDKLSRTLYNDIPYRFYSMMPPVGNSYVEINLNNDEINFTSQTHNQLNNLDMWNNYNMAQMDAQVNVYNEPGIIVRDGLKYVQSSNIQDALVTESQVANVFKWNTTHTSTDIPNNLMTNVRQVPGVVLYYLGNGYSGVYTATVPFTAVGGNLNNVNYSYPTMYGAYYQQYNPEESQVGEDMGHEACRLFVPGCNYIDGRLISPQQIWQPARKFGEENVPFGYNWQGQAIYHELVYKDKRSDISEDLDFVPCIDAVADNDPQGLATRFALAQQKEYYYNRPWFTELNSYTANPDNSSSLASSIISNSNVEYTVVGDLADFITTNGSLSLNDGVASNFSSQNYASITNNSTYKNNNIYIFDFTTGSNVSSVQNIFRSEYFLNLEVSNNQLTSYSWSNGNQTLKNIEPNKRYVIKAVISNSNTKTFYELDEDGTENQLSVMTDTDMNFNNTQYRTLIGLSSYNNDSPFLGTMDFKNCSVQLNGSDTPQTFVEVTTQTKPITDDEFYNNYKLDYNTFADALNLPK